MNALCLYKIGCLHVDEDRDHRDGSNGRALPYLGTHHSQMSIMILSSYPIVRLVIYQLTVILLGFSSAMGFPIALSILNGTLNNFYR